MGRGGIAAGRLPARRPAHGGRFRRLAEERLAQRFRVLAPDLRGHGCSTWEPPWRIETHIDDVLETLDAAGVGAAGWIGQSFGGRLILELCARVPERVERMILLDPAIRVRPDNALRLAEAERAERGFASRGQAVPSGIGGSLLRTPPAFLEEEREAHLEAFEGGFRWRYCQSAVLTILGELATWAPPPERIEASTLLVLGAEESVMGPRQLDRYRRALGNSLLLVKVPGGHVVLWDAYPETSKAVAEFLGAA